MIVINNIPWLTEDKLDASISLKNVPTVKRFTSHYRVIAIAWTDDIKIVTWFRPKSVQINAIYTNQDAESDSKTVLQDDWTLFTTINYNLYNFRDKFSITASATTDIVHIYRGTTLQQRFKMRSFDEDWFKMQHTVNQGLSIDLHLVEIW